MTKCLKGCLLYLLVNLLSLPFLGCASRNEVSHLAFKPLFIEDKNCRFEISNGMNFGWARWQEWKRVIRRALARSFRL